MPRQRIPVEARRRQLVETALTIAERSGIGAVTARSVAAEAKVSLGLVHYCFETTQDLSIQMAEQMVEQLAKATLPALGDPGAGEPKAGAGIRILLELAMGALWSEIVATPTRQLLTYEMTTQALRVPGLEVVAQRLYAVSDQVATELLRQAGELAGITWSAGVAELSRLIVMAVDGATLRWLVDQNSERALTSLSHVADLIASMAIPAKVLAPQSQSQSPEPEVPQ